MKNSMKQNGCCHPLLGRKARLMGFLEGFWQGLRSNWQGLFSTGLSGLGELVLAQRTEPSITYLKQFEGEDPASGPLCGHYASPAAARTGVDITCLQLLPRTHSNKFLENATIPPDSDDWCTTAVDCARELVQD